MEDLKKLSDLFSLGGIETIHIASYATSMSVSVFFDGEPKPRGLNLPRGHYLIMKFVDPSLDRPGLFALVAPKPDESLGGSLGGNGDESRGQNE